MEPLYAGMLIEETRNIARRMGSRGILLCGDPDYFRNQGFCAAEYDKNFPKKEVLHGVNMQKKFEMMLERVRPYQHEI